MTRPLPPLQLGVYLPTWDDEQQRPVRWTQLRELALRAEAMGIDALWVADHFNLEAPTRTLPFWDAWTILTGVAEATTTITLGPLVAGAAFRHPAQLAKMAVTLDEVSGGRLILALGAGSERDASFRSFGYPADRRASLLDEALQIIVPLLRDGHVDFHGRYVQARDCVLGVSGPRPTGPPIWLGGTGPRLQRLAARWSDGFNLNWFWTEPAAVSAALAPLDAACAAVGRDPATLERSANVMVSFAGPGVDMTGLRSQVLTGTAEELAAQLQALHAAGLQHLICSIDLGDEPGPLSALPHLSAAALERFAPVVTALRAIEAAAALAGGGR